MASGTSANRPLWAAVSHSSPPPHSPPPPRPFPPTAPPPRPPRALAFDGKGRLLGAVAQATPAAPNSPRGGGRWGAAPGKLDRRLKGHTDVVVSGAFSRDGELLASGCGGHSGRIWDVATGKEKH